MGEMIMVVAYSLGDIMKRGVEDKKGWKDRVGGTEEGCHDVMGPVVCDVVFSFVWCPINGP